MDSGQPAGRHHAPPTAPVRTACALGATSVLVVVPCKDEVGTLEKCLQSVRAQQPPVRHLVVVDNGSTDGSLEIARRLADQVLELPGASIAGMRNAGAATRPEAHVIGFVDADCELSQGWLASGLSGLAHDDLVGARTAASPDARWVARRWAAIEAARAHGASKIWSQHLLVRREVFDQLGGFDEALTTGEDADLSDRVVAQGGTLRLDPKIAVVHHGFPPDLRTFIRRERWHTRAPGWYARMSRGSRLLVLVGAAWTLLGVLSGASAMRGSRRPATAWASASVAAVPALGLYGSRTPRHAGPDGVLLVIWLVVRVVRLPRELMGSRKEVAR